MEPLATDRLQTDKVKSMQRSLKLLKRTNSEKIREKDLQMFKQQEKMVKKSQEINTLQHHCHSLRNDVQKKTEENLSVRKDFEEVKSQLQHHQTQLKSALDIELNCVICSERMIEAVVSGECGHSFCKRCINTWIDRKPECPICRSECYRTAPAVAIQQLHEKLLDCLDEESRQKYADAVEARKSEPPVVREVDSDEDIIGAIRHHIDLFHTVGAINDWREEFPTINIEESDDEEIGDFEVRSHLSFVSGRSAVSGDTTPPPDTIFDFAPRLRALYADSPAYSPQYEPGSPSFTPDHNYYAGEDANDHHHHQYQSDVESVAPLSPVMPRRQRLNNDFLLSDVESDEETTAPVRPNLPVSGDVPLQRRNAVESAGSAAFSPERDAFEEDFNADWYDSRDQRDSDGDFDYLEDDVSQPGASVNGNRPGSSRESIVEWWDQTPIGRNRPPTPRPIRNDFVHSNRHPIDSDSD